MTRSAPGQVVVASGHMIDAPNRATPRFPPSKEDAVRAQMGTVLDVWHVGPGDVAICGGGRGADLLFSELCIARGARSILCLPLPEAKFLDESVRLPGTNWEARYHAVRAASETRFLEDRDGPPLEGENVFAKNNLWMLEIARAEGGGPALRALLVWDERPTGDGPGGTSHFAAEVRRAGGEVRIVNPTTIGEGEE